MKLLNGLFIGFVVLVLAGVAVGFALPDRVIVQRSIRIESPPEAVFAVLNGFQQFSRWSPWAELDPQMRYTLDGPEQGVGARMSWASDNPNAGTGSQEILAVVPSQQIKLRLKFGGMDTESLVTYALQADGQATQLSWIYEASFGGDLLGRYFGLVLDRMVGPDFEKGLVKLKSLVESTPRGDLGPWLPQVIGQATQADAQCLLLNGTVSVACRA